MVTKAVIFDLGNVLIPYDHRQTIGVVAALFGVDEEVVRSVYAEVGEAFGLGKLEFTDLYARLVACTGAQLVTQAACQEAFCAGMGRDPAALAYTVSLQSRPGITVGVISNTNATHVAWLDEHVPELDELDLVMMSNEVGLLKPDPEIFALALELLEVSATKTLFVDDTAENVAAAAALGMAGIVHRDWKETERLIEAWLGGV